jgi:hypothetical protein
VRGDTGDARRAAADDTVVSVDLVGQRLAVSDPRARREDVLLRLLRRGVTPRTLHLLLPDWGRTIEVAVRRHHSGLDDLAEDVLAS